jgi:hypothetical protein
MATEGISERNETDQSIPILSPFRKFHPLDIFKKEVLSEIRSINQPPQLLSEALVKHMSDIGS